MAVTWRPNHSSVYISIPIGSIEDNRVWYPFFHQAYGIVHPRRMRLPQRVPIQYTQQVYGH